MRFFTGLAALSFAGILLAAGLAVAGDLPPAPKGYTWQDCKDIKTHLLRPDGWHFKEESKGDTGACFLSVEDIDKDGMYRTGLMVNLLRNIPKKKGGLSPSEFARRLADQLATKGQVVDRASFQQGRFKAYRIEYRAKSESNDIKHIATLLAANDKTGSAYVVIFEAPEPSWEKAWAIGKPILEKLGFDDEM